MVAKRVKAAPMAALCVSAITAGELLFDLAKRPGAKRLDLVVREFLRRVDTLPWDHHHHRAILWDGAHRYGASGQNTGAAQTC